MKVSLNELSPAKTKGVSKYFRFDWQFLVDVLRIPFIKEASAVITATPALVDISWIQRLMGKSVASSIWITWAAAIAYILFYIIARLRCPSFIFEYRDFGEYKKRCHSHRFVGWEIVNALKSLRDSAILDEIIEKGLAVPYQDSQCLPLLGSSLERFSVNNYQVFGPNNVGVDLLFYIRKNTQLWGVKIDDSRIDEASTFERNLFWILYTRLTKSRMGWRIFSWCLLMLSILLFLTSIAANIYRASIA